jgi:hypothetical protein
MTPDICVDALTEAIARYGAPEIVNTDQGSQFTSKAWTDVLDVAGVWHQHGWQGAMDRQRVHQAAVAQRYSRHRESDRAAKSRR